MTSLLKLCLSFLVRQLSPRGEEVARLRYLLAMGLFALMLQAAACSPSANQAIDPDDIPDSDTSISDGGTYNPTGSGTADPCAKDAEGNNLYPDCQDESTSNTDPFILTTQSIDFGVNELGAVECSSISIPNGITFSAELDHNSSSVIDASGTCSEAAVDETFAHEFVFQTSGGTYSEARQSGGTGTLTICYVHGCLGSHSAQVKLVAGGDGSAAYAHVISLSGQTSQPYFTVNSPAEMLIFHPDVTSTIGRDDVEGDYTVDVAGVTNVGIDSIFQNVSDPVNSATTDFYADGSTPIIISAAGVKKGANYDTSSGAFSSDPNSPFPLPQTPDIYTITFSRETNKGYTISKDIDVVVPDKPEIEIVLMDTSGVQVTSSSTTDLQNLIVGFKVSNLQLSGPTSGMKVTLSNMTFNGEPIADDTDIYYGQDTDGGEEDADEHLCYNKDASSDYEGFDPDTTLCYPLGNIIEFQSSYNWITVKACNPLGCDEYTSDEPFSFIVDNKRPVVSITSPHENELCYKSGADGDCQANVDTQTLTVSGTVKNYKPVDDPETATVEVAGTTSGASADDVGTYCIPSAEDDAECPESGVRLWVNVPNTTMNQESTPIYVYPVASGGVSVDGRFNQGNCIETETTESLQEGGAGVTEIIDGQVVTTITDTDDSGVTTTTVITTAIDGTVTKTTTVDGEETSESVVTIEDDSETYNADVVMGTDGTVSSTEVNETDDSVITTATTTDPESGEVTQTVNTRLCNVPEGSFSLNLNLKTLYASSENGEALKSKLNYYTNIIEVQGESVSGHRAIGVRSFQYGLESESNFTKAEGNRVKGDLTAGGLGKVDEGCTTSSCVTRAPLMVNLAEGILNDRNIKDVLEFTLNENVSFFDLYAGGALPQVDPDDSDEDDIDVEADFARQWMEATGGKFEDFDFKSLEDTDKQKFIYQALHSGSMAMEMWALWRYQEMIQEQNHYFENEGDPMDPDNYNVATSMCGDTLTDAFVPIQQLQYVMKKFYDNVTSDNDGFEDALSRYTYWPKVAGTNIGYNDFVVGRWIVQKLDIRDDGKIDADICLVPKTSTVDNCDDEITEENNPDHLPAFWGHFLSQALAKFGVLGEYPAGSGGGFNDDTFNLIWSLDKLRINLTDVVSIVKVEVDTDGDGKSDIVSNKLNIDKSKIDFTIQDGSKDVDIVDSILRKGAYYTMHDARTKSNSIYFEPFEFCAEFYEKSLDPSLTPEQRMIYREKLPHGCSDDPQYNYPFPFELNYEYGDEFYAQVLDDGANYYLSEVLWTGVLDFFKSMVGCMDDQIVNPMLNSKAFPFPAWVPEDKQTTLSNAFYVTEELEFTDDETAPDKLANFAIDLGGADLDLHDGGILVRLPFTLGVNDVSNTISKGGFTLGSVGSLKPAGLFSGTNSSNSGWTEANTTGHVVRSQSALMDVSKYPYSADNAQQDVFASASLNLEEVANSVLYLLFKKGPMELLDVFDVEGLEKTNNFQIGFDKVVMGNMDNCGELVPGLVSEISPGILFPDVKNLFEASILHLDIILDKDNPPSFYMDTVDDANADGDLLAAGLNMTHVKLGITNLQIGVKNLYSYNDGTNITYTYEYDTSDCDVGEAFDTCSKPSNPEVLRLRADGVIDLKLWYNETTREVKIYIGSLTEQNLHLSVTNPGLSYDDLNIVSTLYGFFSTMTGTLDINRPFTKSVADDGTVSYSEPTITVSLGNVTDPSLVNLMDNIETDNNIIPLETVSCEDSGIVPPQYYDADGPPPPATETKIGKGKLGQLPLGGMMTNVANLPDVAVNQTDETLPTLGKPVVINPDDFKPGDDFGPGIITDDPCWMYSLDDNQEDEEGNSLDNPLQDALCDFGIKDLTFAGGTSGLRLDFDNTNGYIHLAVELAVQIFDWVNEVSE